jgi:hypothetical protein
MVQDHMERYDLSKKERQFLIDRIYGKPIRTANQRQIATELAYVQTVNGQGNLVPKHESPHQYQGVQNNLNGTTMSVRNLQTFLRHYQDSTNWIADNIHVALLLPVHANRYFQNAHSVA